MNIALEKTVRSIERQIGALPSISTDAYSQTKAMLSFYRDSNAKEIDVFVEMGGLMHPLEIQKSANPVIKTTGHAAP